MKLLKITHNLLLVIVISGLTFSEVTAQANANANENRIEKPQDEMPVYRNPIYPVEQRVEVLLSRMTIKEKIGQMNMPCTYKKSIGWGLEAGTVSLHRTLTPEERQMQMEGCRKFTRGKANRLVDWKEAQWKYRKEN